MKKLVIISNCDNLAMQGVKKKLQYEIKAFEYSGFKVSLLKVEEIPRRKSIIPFSGRYNWNNITVPKDTDILYVRYLFSTYAFLSFLKKIRKDFPYIKILVEIGCYPYDKEFNSLRSSLSKFRDKFYRRFLCRYVDRIVINSDFDYVFGIKAIKFENPIDVDSITLPKRLHYRNDNIINILAVASVAFYYGYDRLLMGLRDYYSTQYQAYKIIFHIVGDGEYRRQLEKMCFDYELSDYVKFYGYLTGDSLSEMYEIADLGVDCLGGHRKDDYAFGTLKSREYISKGIPFITEYTLPQTVAPISHYILKMPADESPIDINEIIAFFKRIIREDKNEVARTMRSFAFDYCDYKVAMLPVTSYLLKF